jgi:cysteinyl-tRNA synthetase
MRAITTVRNKIIQRVKANITTISALTDKMIKAAIAGMSARRADAVA